MTRRLTRRRRLPLRARAALGFALTALLLSVTLALFAYSVTRQQLVDERQGAAIRQAYTNARIVRAGLRSPDVDIPSLLGALQVNSGGAVFLHRGNWFASDVNTDRRAIPPGLRAIAEGGHAVHQRVSIGGTPTLVVGVPIVESRGEYYQLVPLGDIEHTLSRLLSALAIGTALAALVAGGVGILVSRTALSPLTHMAEVARRISGGDLESRLPAEPDPDLAALVDSFNEMVGELQSRIDREARFASDVAHEVRGPLAALAAAVEVANRRRDELPERAIIAVDALQQQVATFNSLVLDLLEISRFDANATTPEYERVDVAGIARAALDEAGCPDVEVRVDGVSPWIDGDPRRLHQAVANLVQNACHYAGGPTLVSVSGDDTTVRLAVEDRGPGIPEEERRLVFARFHRGTTAAGPDLPPGTGLGLALVAAHVDLHRGRAWVEDAPGGGARFVIELPVSTP
jgi:two-component system sensor histidine kinase MtrB